MTDVLTHAAALLLGLVLGVAIERRRRRNRREPSNVLQLPQRRRVR